MNALDRAGAPDPHLPRPMQTLSSDDGSDRVRVLVLGYGNPGRQDDGLGPAAAALIDDLGWPGVTAFENYQLCIEDAIDVAAHDIVWFIDASKVGETPFSVRELSAAPTLDFTSHLVRPETILALAQQYFGGTPQALLLAIRGYDYEFFEGLTPEANENLHLAVQMVSDEIRHLQTSRMAS